MSKTHEETFHQLDIHDKESHEKMVNIIGNQGDAN